ncbi:MAG: VWA domain-containing protein [Verrucomicrobia bacterium]|nr:VWA domain-containing protein [Verrucomicrobiota bacterium]
MPQDKNILPSVLISRQRAFPDPLVEQRRETLRQRRTTALLGMTAALLVHAALIGAFMYIAIGAMRNRQPPMVVITEGYDPQEQVKQQEMHTRVTERPARPSAQASNPIVASSIAAPISAPEIEPAVDDPLDFGTGLGDADGLGFSGMGSGFGGTTFMGLKGGGKNIILVIDTSSSMPRNCGDQGIAAIRREINKTINSFGSSTSFNIICYADDADAFRKESVPATKDNIKEAIKFMEPYFNPEKVQRTRTQAFAGDPEGSEDPWGSRFYAIYPGQIEGLEGTSGGSRIELGIVAAMELLPSTIFVLSDGEPNTRNENGKVPHEELIKLVEANYKRLYEGRKLVINTLSINDQGEKFLTQISDTFNGRHRKIDPNRL